MSNAFPRVGVLRRGYDPSAVDDFFVDARHAYEGGAPPEEFSSDQVRRATFFLKRNGYEIDSVDSAMCRLEAAFVQRDRAAFIASHGEQAWYEQVAERATTLYPRLRRPHGERFSRPAAGEKGYSTEAVDELLDRLAAFFDDRGDIGVEDIRHSVFPIARAKSAYAEGPVDAFLGRAIDILLAVN
ncbi:MAG: cell division protein DivIVA [Actinomycetaceae bacterium]|nr:cell division protein DivIVA [Actinomycetaceae bacterium]